MNRPSIRTIIALRSDCSGFTLIELLVVLVILSLVASLVSVNYYNHLQGAKVDAAKTQISTLGMALDGYMSEIGRYPTTEEGLAALVNAPPGVEKWKGPYLKKGQAIPQDPWGNPYSYTGPGLHGDYDLMSFGADGQPGGEDRNADITSWDKQ